MNDSIDHSNSDRAAVASTVQGLWRRAPIWRAILYAAVAVTCLAFILFKVGRSPSPSQVPAHYQQSQTARKGDPSTKAPPPVENSDSKQLEEEEAQAVCHPHLLTASNEVPQIDVSRIQSPASARTMLHFWINGEGVVVKESSAQGTLGTPEERAAEAVFARGLSFTVPHTEDCQSRELELIGEFFEKPSASGHWSTLVRLYPRFTLSDSGALQDASRPTS